MEPRRQFKAWALTCFTTLIICLDSTVDAEKKRLYIKTEAKPKQIHHHHYYTMSDPMFGSSQSIPMKSHPASEVFDKVKYNRGPPSSRYNHMDYYHHMDSHHDHPHHDHPHHDHHHHDLPYPSHPDHYHDNYDSYPKAARLMRMAPPPMLSPPSNFHHHSSPLDMPEDTMPPKSARSRRFPTYHVSPDIHSPEFQRSPFHQFTDKHHNVRHVYTSEVEMEDY